MSESLEWTDFVEGGCGAAGKRASYTISQAFGKEGWSVFIWVDPPDPNPDDFLGKGTKYAERWASTLEEAKQLAEAWDRQEH